MVKVPRVSFDYLLMSQEGQKAHMRTRLLEEAGEKYARAAGHKGIGGGHDRDWLIKEMSDELKAWGHAGGT